jgi:hypothetical protein
MNSEVGPGVVPKGWDYAAAKDAEVGKGNAEIGSGNSEVGSGNRILTQCLAADLDGIKINSKIQNLFDNAPMDRLKIF